MVQPGVTPRMSMRTERNVEGERPTGPCGRTRGIVGRMAHENLWKHLRMI